MKTIVVYDSMFGNTKKIAEAIAQNITSDVEMLNVKDIILNDLGEFDCLVFGSPTHGGQAKVEMKKFLAKLNSDIISGKKVVVFDTRAVYEDQSMWLRWLMNFIGFAAPKIAKHLEKNGGEMIDKPMGFYVLGKEGPLKEGELDRAREWGQSLFV